MTDSSERPVDYARALAAAAAYLAARPNEAPGSRWGVWASLRPSEDLRYPVPEMDPARR